MEKILILVSALFLIGGAGMAFVKRSKFIETRNQKDGLNTQITQIFDEYENTTEPALKKVIADYKQTNQEKLEAIAQREIEEQDLAKVKKEIVRVKGEQAEEAEKLKNANALMAKLEGLLKQFGDDVDPDDIPKIIDGLKTEKRNLEEEVQTLTAELGVLQDDLDKNENWLEGYDSRQQKRAVRVSRNSLEAVITAVNNDYGVVVFKAGKENGVDNDSRLLIKRGANIVGRLNIISVDDYKTVASIDQKSLAKGASVLPGDRVIFRDLQK